MKLKIALLLAACVGCGSLPLDAAYIFKNGKFLNSREVATHSVQEHFSFAHEAFEKKDWEECLRHAIIINKNFPDSAFSHESLFFSAVCYFHLKEYDFSNRQFSEYLKSEAPSKHFEEAIGYKFKIAEQFQSGVKKHLLGSDALPKWMPAEDDALSIYDEVIAALPHHDLGAQALYGKAALLLSAEEFQESVDTLQLLIRRFPKHALTPESYLKIADIYLQQTKSDYPDPDLLDLAEMNIKKFRVDFPSETRIDHAVHLLMEMQEVYAKSLYETGRFYERTKKPSAAIIYYSKIVTKYPETGTAKLSEKRLQVLNKGKIVQRAPSLPKEEPAQEIVVDAAAPHTAEEVQPVAENNDPVVAPIPNEEVAVQVEETPVHLESMEEEVIQERTE